MQREGLVLFLLFNINVALKIALGEDEAAEGAGMGVGSPYSETQREALHVSAAATVENCDADTSENQQNVDGIGAEDGSVTKIGLKTMPIATFGSKKLEISIPAFTPAGIGAVHVELPKSAAEQIKASIAAGGAAVTRVGFICGTPSSAMAIGADCQIQTCTAAGGCSIYPVSDLAQNSCIRITFQKESPGDDQCVYYDPVDGLPKTNGLRLLETTDTTITCCATHLTDFGSQSGGGGGAHGDPKATNLRGEKFDILAMGTFSLLSVSSKVSAEKKLSLDATIDRAGEMCGATYIKNVTMTGSWITDETHLSAVQINAVAGAAKSRALQIALDDSWYAAKDVKGASTIIKKATSKEIDFSIGGVKIQVLIDAHRIRAGGVKTEKFANFLNVNVKGLNEVKNSGVHLGGLLAYDDHEFAAQTPNECKRGTVRLFKQKLGYDAEPRFFSNLKAD